MSRPPEGLLSARDFPEERLSRVLSLFTTELIDISQIVVNDV